MEAVALGWKARRILKVKEVQNRIKQIHDYENAEEQTLEEAKKRDKTISPEERQKLMNLIEGFRLSRKNTVVKFIKLMHNMEDRGLWLTYFTAELADEGLRTPRKSAANAPEAFLKRGARTNVRESQRSDPFLRISTETAIANASSPYKYL